MTARPTPGGRLGLGSPPRVEALAALVPTPPVWALLEVGAARAAATLATAGTCAPAR